MDCTSHGYTVSGGKLSATLNMTAGYVKSTGVSRFDKTTYYGQFKATSGETPMAGFLFDGGVSFTGDLRTGSRDIPAGETITVVDHSTSPTTTYTGNLSSAKTMTSHGAVVLPKLTDSFNPGLRAGIVLFQPCRRRQVAWAARPSSRPTKPRCSVVVALTETQLTGRARTSARVWRIPRM